MLWHCKSWTRVLLAASSMCLSVRVRGLKWFNEKAIITFVFHLCNQIKLLFMTVNMFNVSVLTLDYIVHLHMQGSLEAFSSLQPLWPCEQTPIQVWMHCWLDGTWFRKSLLLANSCYSYSRGLFYIALEAESMKHVCWSNCVFLTGCKPVGVLDSSRRREEIPLHWMFGAMVIW